MNYGDGMRITVRNYSFPYSWRWKNFFLFIYRIFYPSFRSPFHYINIVMNSIWITSVYYNLLLHAMISWPVLIWWGRWKRNRLWTDWNYFVMIIHWVTSRLRWQSRSTFNRFVATINCFGWIICRCVLTFVIVRWVCPNGMDAGIRMHFLPQ